MSTKLFRISVLFTIIAIVLTACAAPTPTQAPASVQPVASQAPTNAAVAQQPTATHAPAQASAVPATTTRLNDLTQARLRLAPFVLGGPFMDLYVNGVVAVNGGQEQVNIPAGYITAYMFLAPGTYSIAVAPTGKGLSEAILGPMDVTLAAGHRYTIAMLGQLTDKNFTSIVIDDTAALQKARTSSSQNILFVVNNLLGAKTIDFNEDGHGPQGVGYGAFDAAPIQVGRHKNLAITANGDPKAWIDGGAYDGNGEEPGIDFMVGFIGRFPGAIGSDFDVAQSAPTSDLNTLDLLQGFSNAGFESEGQAVTFNTFLAAIKTAGLTNLFTTGDPYLVLAPTDAAFAAIPKATFDKLMADPKALADLVRNHIIAGYVPRGSLAKTPGGPFDRTFTNMLGKQIAIGSGYTVNGINVGDIQSYFTANGTQVHPITTVLLPGS